jgi:hypothetical protein
MATSIRKITESYFQNKVKKQLEKDGAFIINLHGHGWQKKGLPDLEIIHRKWDGFLELKVENNKASVIQKAISEKIIKRDRPCYVLRCITKLDVDGEFVNFYKFKYTIENFNGEIIIEFKDLKNLLSLLVELTDPKRFVYNLDISKLRKSVNSKISHCIYAEVSKETDLPLKCNYPGMDCIDAICDGYNKCINYKEGSRKIKK